MSQIVYSRSRPADLEGKTYQNPRFFSEAIQGAEAVWIDGDWPEIEAAYAGAGVKVLRLDSVAPVPAPTEPRAAEPGTIPADWRELPWSQPDERGLTLRGLASAVSEESIRTKDDAIAAIEAHLGPAAGE